MIGVVSMITICRDGIQKVCMGLCKPFLEFHDKQKTHASFLLEKSELCVLL